MRAVPEVSPVRENPDASPAPGGPEAGAGALARVAARVITGDDDPQVVLVDTHNRGFLCRLSEVPAGAAFAVEVPPGLVVVDLDDDPGGRVAARLAAVAAAGGCETVLVRSGPGERRWHLWCPVPVGDPVRARLLVAAREAGGDVRRWVRPPWSAHRSGGAVATPVRPGDPRRVLEVLARGAGRRSAGPGGRLGRYLRDGWVAGGWRSESEARAALVTWAVAAGRSRAWVRAVLNDPDGAAGRSWRRRPARWREAELERLCGRADRWVRDHRARWDRWVGALRAARWSGTAGLVDLAVAEAVAAAAVGPWGPSGSVRVSVRVVAARAGVRPLTARRSLGRLVDAGWLRVTDPGGPGRARCYALEIPAGLMVGGAGSPDGAGALLGWLGHDAARRGGVGRAGMRVWRELGERPFTTRELAGRLGVSASSVRAALARLRRVGMAVRVAGCGWITGPMTPGALARRVGLAGRGTAELAEVFERAEQRRRTVRGQRADGVLRGAAGRGGVRRGTVAGSCAEPGTGPVLRL